MSYNLPGPPSARAARRRADLQYQIRRKRFRALRQDRRREAFRTMKRRLKIVQQYRARRRTASSEAEAASQTASRCSISLRSVRRFDHQYRHGGKRALLARYQHLSRPKTTLSPDLIEIILALRQLLGWCGQRIAAELEQRRLASLSHTTIYRLFRRYHVAVRTYHPQGKRDGIRYRRQHVKAPNWTWHVDFAGPWQDTDGTKRSLVVVIDSYSRMLLGLEVVEQQSSQVVEALLARLFERYGRPKVLITDNGRAFAPSFAWQQHRFGHFLAEHAVEHRRTGRYYPQTNGKAEAAIKTLEREFLSRLDRAWHWSAVEAEAERFRGWYNFYRAHSALGYEVPASRYGGIRLPKRGLENLFGMGPLLPQARLCTEQLPTLTQANRLDCLSLAVVA